jgi:hypothetical protein
MKRALIAGMAAFLCVVAVLEGRRESRDAIRVNIENMLRIQVAEGATGTGAPFAITYDAAGRITCLIFRTSAEPIGLQTCYDRMGRLIEAVDQTRPGAHFWSLRYDTGAAPVEINPLALTHLIHSPELYTVIPGYLP